MSINPEVKLLLDEVSAGVLDLDTLPILRKQYDRRRNGQTYPDVRTIDLSIAEVPCRFYRPTQSDDAGLLVYLHGGGWVMGGLDSHDHIARALAYESGECVLAVAYALAPQFPFPAGLSDVERVLNELPHLAGELGISMGRIAIGGDSAGGNLSAVATHSLSLPFDFRFQLLLYPITDARCIQPSYFENADGYLLTADRMRWFVSQYCPGGVAPDDPRISPLMATSDALASSPPTLIITAGLDPLRDEGELYGASLTEAGVLVSSVRFTEMVHGFAGYLDRLRDAQLAIGLSGAAVQRALR